MDLGAGFWIGGNRRVRALHRVYSTLAATVGAGRVQRNESAGPADFPEPLLERMATHDHITRDSCAGDARRTWRDVPAASPPSRIGIGAGACGIVRGDDAPGAG